MQQQQSTEDFIYERMLDAIENGAKDNELREEYARLMSQGNFNNTNVSSLFTHVLGRIEFDWNQCRDQRDEDNLIFSAIDAGIAAHIGYWVTHDRELANAIQDDRVWRDLQDASNDWDNVNKQLSRGIRGGTSQRGGGGLRGNDSNYGRAGQGLGYNQSRPISGSGLRQREDRQNTRMSGGFGGGAHRNVRAERNAAPSETAVRSGLSSQRAPRNVQQAPAMTRQARVAEPVDVIEEEIFDSPVEGPDLTLERPYDSFWDQGENWQLAHCSSLQWTWSAKQQTRRTYNPDEEVRFLVQGKDNKVREEFIPMTDDLNFASHEIKALHRPLSPRGKDGEGLSDNDIAMPGKDIDAVDLDKLSSQLEEARKVFISEMSLSSIHRISSPVITSTMTDGLTKATVDRLNTGKDIAVSQTTVATILPSTGKGKDELVNLAKYLGPEVDLQLLSKRLKTLVGKVDESVLEFIDRHYTREVNHSLLAAFGFDGLVIDSFIFDFEDLLGVIRKRRNDSWAAQFLTRTRSMAATLLFIGEDDGRQEIIDDTNILPINDDDSSAYTLFREGALVAMQPCATISVNLDLEAFGAVDGDTRVPPSSGPGADAELKEALTTLYSLGRTASLAGRVYLITADNIQLELVAIAGARDIVGIRRM